MKQVISKQSPVHKKMMAIPPSMLTKCRRFVQNAAGNWIRPKSKARSAIDVDRCIRKLYCTNLLSEVVTKNLVKKALKVVKKITATGDDSETIDKFLNALKKAAKLNNHLVSKLFKEATSLAVKVMTLRK